MSRTELFSRKQAGGVFVITDESKTTGTIFWVDSNTGTDAAGYGRTPDTPVATLDYAVGLCTANKQDRIYLMPGHAESIASATGAVVDIAGVEIIGIGYGAKVPTFTLGTATAATISITAANVHVSNIKVISDLADVAAGITAAATADGLVVENCWFTDGAAAKELVIGISLAADCDNVKILNNYFTTVDGGGCASAVKFVGATDDTWVVGNTMQGDYSAACIDGGTAGGTKIHIHDNVLWNTDAAAGLCLTLHATSTGSVVRNLAFGGKDGTSPFAAAGALVAENYGSNAAGASGIILPAVDS